MPSRQGDSCATGVAKGYREVVRAQERHEWLADSPGKTELAGSRAIGAAFLDVTDSEPLPPDHPLWRLEHWLLKECMRKWGDVLQLVW